MSGFKFYREKKQRWEKPIEEDDKNYIDLIVAAGEKYFKANMELPVEAVVEAAFRDVLEMEIEKLEKKVKNSVLYASDILKEKYPKRINTNIKDGESKNDK